MKLYLTEKKNNTKQLRELLNYHKADENVGEYVLSPPPNHSLEQPTGLSHQIPTKRTIF